MNERRNKQIYDWVIRDEYPVKLVVKATGISRQGIHQILDRMISKYGGEKQEYKSGPQLSRARIDAQTESLFVSEKQRLGIGKAAIIRLAINQARKNGLKYTQPGGDAEYTSNTPLMNINDSQQEYLLSCATSLTKAEKIRQILKSYKPINIEVTK